MPKIDFQPIKEGVEFKPKEDFALGPEYESALEKLYMEGPEDITPEEAELLSQPYRMATMEDPKSIEQSAKDTLAIADQEGISISNAEEEQEGRRNAQQFFVAAKEPSLPQRAWTSFIESLAPFKIFKRLGQAGIYYPTKYAIGLALYTPELITDEPAEYISGFVPTPNEEQAGEFVSFMGSLRAVGYIIRPLISRLPLREAMRLITSGGLQFGTRAAVEETVRKLPKGEMPDTGKIAFETLWGIVFGGAEAGASKLLRWNAYRNFVKERPEFKAFPRKLLMRIDEMMRSAQRGMPKKRLVKIYGKDVEQFMKLIGEKFGTGVIPKAPSELPGAVAGKPVEPLRAIEKVKPPTKIAEKPPVRPVEAITPEISPEVPKGAITPAEPTVGKARPFKAVVYRGVSEKTPISTGFAAGTHYTTDKKLAKSFAEDYGKKGKLIEKEIILKNPLYLTDVSDFGAEANKIIAGREAKGEVFSEEERGDIFSFLTRESLEKQGYDGIVYNEGEEIIVFAKPEVAEKPAEVKKKGMRPGKIDVSGFAKTAKGIMNIIEPTKIATMKVGKEPVAAVIRGIHETDVGRVEFEQKEIDLLDKSILDTEKELNKFSNKDLENLMLARGEPVSAEAKLLQKEAIAALPKALQGPKFRQAIQEVADFNFKYLRKVFGPDIKKFKDYFYGLYKDPKKVSKFLDHWQSTERYLKEKKFPTYADAKAWGLEIKNPNPITNLRSEYVAVSHISGMMWMKNELMRNGEGKYIWTKEQAPTSADKIYDWTFNDVRVDPDLAKLINNLIAKNKITGVPVLNTIRQVNNFIRTVKFVGSAFHLMSIAKQSVADSGYLGFLQPQKWVGFHRRPGSFVPIGIHKESAALGITLGFGKNDPIFQTPFYKRYIANGGGHRYAVESEAARAFTQAIDEINKHAATGIKVGMLPLQIPKGFADWMFQSYIPKVKYAKTLDWYNKQSKKLGRELTDSEFQEIIKEGQNFYGMMNERIFGRSGTVTTLARFYFMSPGYAEGNYRTMIKAATQWGFGEEGFKASRSRSNIINSWLLTGILATTGTLILTGKWPKKPERLEDIRDLFKIDTGKVDNKGKAIMIDLMTYDKDYWNVAFNTLRLRPDIALDKSIKRIGGMKAPMAEVTHDLVGIAMGKALVDWKKDEVFYPTDDFIVKMTKLINYEVRRLEPISTSVYKQSRRREIDRVTAAIESLAGLRPAYTEADRRERQYISQMYSLRGQREELSWLIGKAKDPMGIVKKYNQTVNEILDSSIVSEEIKDEWRPKLLIDEMKVFTWKRFPPEKMTIAQLKIAREARTYKADQKALLPPENWRPHKGYEERIKKINAELSKRKKG